MDNPFRGALYNALTTQLADYLLMAVVLLSCVEVGGWVGGCAATALGWGCGLQAMPFADTAASTAAALLSSIDR